MTDKLKELLPCPFCGDASPNLIYDDYVHDDLRPMPVVECTKCHTWVRAEAWNNRAPLPAVEAAEIEVVARIEKHAIKAGTCPSNSEVVLLSSLRRILAGVNQQPGSGWQPIETAPKDGTEIILRKCDRVTSGAFIDWTKCHSEFTSTGEYLGQVEYDGGANWMSFDGGFREDDEPTHWQPLPPSPAAKAGD